MASSHSLEHNSPLSSESFTLYSFMDEVESRVEALRRQANSLIQEQASLLMVMDHLKEESLRSLITPGKIWNFPLTHCSIKSDLDMIYIDYSQNRIEM